MTFNVKLGIDPGLSGAIAILADGEPAGFIDMPTIARNVGKGMALDSKGLAALLRGVLQQHTGAYVSAVLEYVNAMPSTKGAEGEQRQAMGSSSAFRFGEGYGQVKGVLDTLGIDRTLVFPQQWKAHHWLLKQEKDAARIRAIKLAPTMAAQLARKKDVGRADALLIALYSLHTETHTKAA
jgi:crossover junction endodeoxyribonuclease RuvC